MGERVKILQTCGQDSLAFLTAKTHGLEEEASAIKEALPEDAQLPQVAPGAQLLKPPTPILQTESNWPLLTVSKGFFEGIKAVRGGAQGPGQPVIQVAASALDMGDEAMDANAGAGWDDDEEPGFGEDVDDDLELPPELEAQAVVAADADEGYFVAPTKR